MDLGLIVSGEKEVTIKGRKFKIREIPGMEQLLIMQGNLSPDELQLTFMEAALVEPKLTKDELRNMSGKYFIGLYGEISRLNFGEPGDSFRNSQD